MKSRGKNWEEENGRAKEVQPRWGMRDGDRGAAVGSDGRLHSTATRVLPCCAFPMSVLLTHSATATRALPCCAFPMSVLLTHSNIRSITWELGRRDGWRRGLRRGIGNHGLAEDEKSEGEEKGRRKKGEANEQGSREEGEWRLGFSPRSPHIGHAATFFTRGTRDAHYESGPASNKGPPVIQLSREEQRVKK